LGSPKDTIVHHRYHQDPLNALEALDEAQKLAFSPFAFQACHSLKELGILDAIDNAGKEGLTVEQIAEQTKISCYGVSVLLDMGLSIGLVFKPDESFIIAKMGKFVLYDDMTRVNMEFTHDVCYRALFHLKDSILAGRPEGLKELGDWPNIYPALADLPGKSKKAWHDFDHHYSDRAFPVTLPLVFRSNPKHICDIGGNTGRWSLECVKYDSEVNITLLDLPMQTARASENIKAEGFQERVKCQDVNMLEQAPNIPEAADIYWMSQFLDCFSEAEIITILTNIRKAMSNQSKIYIMELLWDEQPSLAAQYSLNAISLYFTALANGNSRFYQKSTFLQLIEKAGLTVCEQINGIGPGHTLLVCQPK
jgi:hypothetical protein